MTSVVGALLKILFSFFDIFLSFPSTSYPLTPKGVEEGDMHVRGKNNIHTKKLALIIKLD